MVYDFVFTETVLDKALLLMKRKLQSQKYYAGADIVVLVDAHLIIVIHTLSIYS